MADRLFSGIFARGDAAEAVSDEAWLAAILEFEATLARTQSRLGLIPADAARAIVAACAPGAFDIARLGREAADSAQPLVPVVAALRAAVPDGAAPYVHQGATSQDALDSAAMLVAHRALAPALADARAAADALAALAAEHTATPMLGRTLLQPARPTSFGVVAAGWMTQLDSARAQATATRARLPVQLGGPVGDLAAYGDRGLDLVGELARELGLAVPALPWHGDRTPIAWLAGSLALLAGAAAKFAHDVVLLARGELGEVRERPEPGRGGSSSMAHKQNPVAAISALACAARVPGLTSTLFSGMTGDLQRAAGAWQAEWETLSDALRLTGSALAWARELAERLEVNPAAMAAHLGDETPDLAASAVLVRHALAARPA